MTLLKDIKINYKTEILTAIATIIIMSLLIHYNAQSAWKEGYLSGYNLGKEAGENGYPIDGGVISELSNCKSRLDGYKNLVNQSIDIMNNLSTEKSLLELKLMLCEKR